MHTQPTTSVNVPTVPGQQDKPLNARQPRHAWQRGQVSFRRPTAEREPPSARRVFTLSFWAAISIFIGLIPAGRLVVGVAFQSFIFPWYPLSTASIGILGLILMASAFASIHRAHVPWYLMTIATLLLAVNVAMVYLVSF